MTANKKSRANSKDSPQRSLMKTISWRLIASATTFSITLVVFLLKLGDTDTTMLLGTVTLITILDMIAKLIFYYLHERLWTNIEWGKFWRRRAWKKHYRKMHELQEKRQEAS